MFRINSGSLQPPRGGWDEWDSLDTFDTTSQTPFAVDTGRGITLKPYLRQTGERTKEDNRSHRYRGLTSNFQK